MGCCGSKPKPEPPRRVNNMTKQDFLEPVTVVVGEEETQFTVHKNVICGSSEFFRAALNGEWKEAADKTVTFTEIKSELFGVYLGWLYTGRVDIRESRKLKYGKDISGKDLIQAHADLVDAFCLGDYLQDSSFRNGVVDEMKHAIEQSKELKIDITYLWDHARHDSTLAKMVIDYFAADHKADEFDEAVVDLPATFVMEIAKISVREAAMEKEDRKPQNRLKCYYHEHKTAADKCK